MYLLKQQPEDFIVKEKSNILLSTTGKYAIYALQKKNYTTEKAIHLLCKYNHLQRKQIGYAGNKDKQAVTTQHISVFQGKKEYTLPKDITLTFLGYAQQPISLGDLEGNEFTLIIRNADKKSIAKLQARMKNITNIPNYFDEQRFAKNNVAIGTCIIKGDMKDAVNLILQQKGDYETLMKQYLEKYPHNYVQALRKIPLKILTMYIHAVQSAIFNSTLREYIKKNNKNIKIPLTGFGTDLDKGKISTFIKKELKKMKITQNDFIIRTIPELSSEGSFRDAFMDAKQFRYSIENDELHNGKEKIKLSFFLQKGSYATIVAKFLLS
ncbi:tRNA pseudouridine(13) synthase TruD [Candidatus Woesearchaeota archaeon]|nr:MAG: tRNA pseudouridine(13) synthase TruD [Candidatus Woesearchaeota archaeon]